MPEPITSKVKFCTCLPLKAEIQLAASAYPVDPANESRPGAEIVFQTRCH